MGLWADKNGPQGMATCRSQSQQSAFFSGKSTLSAKSGEEWQTVAFFPRDLALSANSLVGGEGVAE
jgi:hypothetical protein